LTGIGGWANNGAMIARFFFTILLLFVPSQLMAAWRVAETAHFRVYADMPESRLRDKAALLEDFRGLLDLMTTAKSADGMPKLDVYIVDKLSTTMPFGTLQSGIAGYYIASARGIAAFASSDDFGQQTLLHEYAHHHMFANTGLRYPGWYVEGFAEYFSTARFAPAQIEFGQAPPQVGYLLKQGTDDWSSLLSLRGGEQRGMAAAIFYARAWALTHYLFRQGGQRDRLLAYLAAVAAGTPGPEAFARHVADPATLQRTVTAYLGSKNFTYSRLTRQPQPAAAISVRTLPPAADALLMMHASLTTRGAAATDQADALARVRAAAARFPDDPLATRTLALAELHWGDKEKAVALLAQALAASPEDPDLLRLHGQALLAADAKANRGLARRALVDAVNRNPADWQAMRLYVHTHDLVGSLIPNSLFNVIQTMWSLAPQVEGNSVDMAVAMIRRNQLPEAAKVLEPLAFAPHGSSEFLRRLHAAAKAGDQTEVERLLADGRKQ
jgi:tetratricopeptide (TPR) repeat protein